MKSSINKSIILKLKLTLSFFLVFNAHAFGEECVPIKEIATPNTINIGLAEKSKAFVSSINFPNEMCNTRINTINSTKTLASRSINYRKNWTKFENYHA